MRPVTVVFVRVSRRLYACIRVVRVAVHAHAHLARTVSAFRERLETSPANAVAVSRTPAVDPRPLVAEVARVEQPARVGIGSEGEHGVRVVAHCSNSAFACTPVGTRQMGAHGPGTV